MLRPSQPKEKGKQLLFPTVKIELPGRDNGQAYEKRIERIKVLDHRLTYMAITRTRFQLFIPYIGESSLIRKLKNC
jgi:hypothetical protein